MADRHYEPDSGHRISAPKLPPVTKALLILNVAIFLIDIFGEKIGLPKNALVVFGAFRIESAIFEGRIWEFLTFQFLHANVMHILFNSMGLYFFGPWMERWWGSTKFAVFYLICGAGGALLYSLLVFAGLLGSGILVGASAGIYGILIGIAVIAPQLRVQLLFPPVVLTMRQMALFTLGFAVFAIFTGFGGNAGGEAGHLGGAIIGFLLVKFPVLLGWCGKRDPDIDIIRPKAFRRQAEPKLRPRVDLRKDSEIDLILDKISRDGFASLTDEEREKLHKASQKPTE